MSDPQTLTDSLEHLCNELDTYSLEAYQYGENAAKLEREIFAQQAAYLTTLTKENGFSSDKLRDAALAIKFPKLGEIEFSKAMNKRCLERCDAVKTQISAKQSLLRYELERPR